MRLVVHMLFLLILIPTLPYPVRSQTGIEIQLTKFTIDGGGGVSSGGDFEMNGTVGQPDAGAHTGGDYTILGGFWFGGSQIIDPPKPFDFDVAAGNVPALNPRCDVFDLLVIIEDRRENDPSLNTDFNTDTFEDGIDILFFSLGWYRTPDE